MGIVQKKYNVIYEKLLPLTFFLFPLFFFRRRLFDNTERRKKHLEP